MLAVLHITASESRKRGLGSRSGVSGVDGCKDASPCKPCKPSPMADGRIPGWLLLLVLLLGATTLVRSAVPATDSYRLTYRPVAHCHLPGRHLPGSRLVPAPTDRPSSGRLPAADASPLVLPLPAAARPPLAAAGRYCWPPARAP